MNLHCFSSSFFLLESPRGLCKKRCLTSPCRPNRGRAEVRRFQFVPSGSCPWQEDLVEPVESTLRGRVRAGRRLWCKSRKTWAVLCLTRLRSLVWHLSGRVARLVPETSAGTEVSDTAATDDLIFFKRPLSRPHYPHARSATPHSGRLFDSRRHFSFEGEALSA